MEKVTTVLLLLALSLTHTIAQKVDIPKLPDGYFIKPITHRVSLSGNFCELRNNHFHAGLDFRSSNGVPGDPIVATADGFISRVKIQAGNYGQSLYLSHSCGLTSVYAHLSSFTENIERFVKDFQQETESFEIDVSPDSSLFVFSQGDTIGFMGNTGHSFGPHLHFEIRESSSDIPINPMFFGLGVVDTRQPIIELLAFDLLDEDHNPVDQIGFPLRATANGMASIDDTLYLPAGKCGLVARIFDRQNISHFKNGIYSIELGVDGKLIYKFTATHCSFEETIQMNAHVDYPRRIEKGQWATRCYILPNNTLSLYENTLGDGIIELKPGDTRSLQLMVGDFHGNQNNLSIVVKATQKEDQPTNAHESVRFQHHKSNYFSLPHLAVLCPKDALFSTTSLEISCNYDSSSNQLIEVIIGDPTTALKRPLEIHIDTEVLNKGMHEKVRLVYLDHRNGKPYSAGATVDVFGMKTRIPYLGRYAISYDTIPPQIDLIKGRSRLNSNGFALFNIKDDIEVIGDASELKIDQFIDGKWVIGNYDLKSHTLEVPFVDLKKGIHKISIKARDDRNNESQFSADLQIP